jgi:hypothetical protein
MKRKNLIVRLLRKFFGSRKQKHCKNTVQISRRNSIIIGALVGLSLVVFSRTMTYFEKTDKIDRLEQMYKKVEDVLLYNQILKKVTAIEYATYKIRRKIRYPYKYYWGRVSEKTRKKIALLLTNYKIFRNLDVDGYLSIISSETYWDCSVTSHMGAKGLAQMMQETFDSMNRSALFKFGFVSIYNVANNVEASIIYYLKCRESLKFRLKREPTLAEISAAYNGGLTRALRVFGKKLNTKYYLPAETQEYMLKADFFYKCYKKQQYNVYWNNKKGVVYEKKL